jgi:hypothetical protein
VPDILKPNPYLELLDQTAAAVSLQVVSQVVSGIVLDVPDTFMGLLSEALTWYPPAPPLATVNVSVAVAAVWATKWPKLMEIFDMLKEKGIIE